MQSSLYSPSETFFQHQIPWKTSTLLNPKPQSLFFKNPKPHNPKPSNSLKTSSSAFVSNRGGEEPPTLLNLPVAIHSRSGKVFRYLWDGTNLQLVNLNGVSSNWLTFNYKTAIWDFFIPRRVNENYLNYVKWKFFHRIFSSALQVLATQAMFRAMGVGYSRSLSSAAALNWVLKDGLGRFSRCVYTASLASAFDTNMKRVRFSTSVLFSLSIGVELLTPSFPQYFLLLASVANIAKQISLACYLATCSSVHRSFAIADNLGEISAKAQIQTVCFDNLGLVLAALLNILCRNSQRLQAALPFLVYPFFSAIDLFGIYQGLKYVHLQTLTKNRLEIVLDTWIQSERIPSPAQVSKEEGIDFPWGKGRKLWSIRIGCVDLKDLTPKFSMMTMRSLRGDDSYFICMETYHRSFIDNPQRGLLLCLREGANTEDIIMGLHQACNIRKELLRSSRWQHIVDANSNISESDFKEWIQVLDDSKRCLHADGDIYQLKEKIKGAGWAVKNVLLSVQEQARYSILDD